MIFKKIALAFVLAGMIGGSKTLRARMYVEVEDVAAIVAAATAGASFVMLCKNVANVAKEHPELTKKECWKQGFAEWRKNSHAGKIIAGTSAVAIGVFLAGKASTELGIWALNRVFSNRGKRYWWER